jgi:hypothetical protein
VLRLEVVRGERAAAELAKVIQEREEAVRENARREAQQAKEEKVQEA